MISLTSPLSPAVTTPATSSLDAMRQRQEARAKDALTALQTLKSQKSSDNEEKKAAARKKVEDLKARIRSLRMTMVGNPEAMAKMAAQLARELGAAVKAYAAAGGSTAGMGAPATPAGDASAGEASGAEASGAEGGEDQAQAATAEAEAAAGDAEKTSAEDKAAQDSSTRDPYRQVIERQQAQAAEQARQNADKEADDKFASDVKGLVNELKAILRKAAEEAKRKGESTESPDQKTADKALAEIDDALGDIASPMAGLGFSLKV